MSKIVKASLRAAGFLLALASIVWIIFRFVKTGTLSGVVHSPNFGRLAWSAAFAIPVYTGGLCCAGLAWWCLQAAFLPERPQLRLLFSTYATTQFAKYLPGNVGHYIGRHLLLRRLGMSHQALLLATLGEAACLVLASLVWASGAMALLWPRLGASLSAPEVLLIECICVGLGYISLQAIRRNNDSLRRWIPLHTPTWLLPVFPLQLLLFAAMALALMFPAHVLLPDSRDLWLVPAAAATSWVAGFLVVGAPAGIGVREVVFLAVLHGHMPETDILLLAATFRVITFGGDITFLLLGLLLRIGAGGPERGGDMTRHPQSSG